MTATSLRPTGAFWASARARHMMPVAFVTYSLAYLDRSNYSIGSAGGMAHDLHLSAGVNSLIAASFFLGYFLFQVPGTVYAERHSARRLVAWSMVAWGVLAALQGVLSRPAELVTVRFLLGVVEGAVLPSMVMLLGRWFTKGERSRANTYLILGNPITVMWLSAVSGWLVGALNWRAMFVIEGVPAIAWGVFCLRALKDRPRDAGWVGRQEAADLEEALAGERAAATGDRAEPASAAYRTVLRSRPVRMLALQYFFWSFGVYGFVFWLPSIIKQGSGEGIAATGVLSAVPYAFAAVAMLVNAQYSDRSGRRPGAVWPWLVVGALALYGSYALHTSFAGSFALLVVAGLCIYAPYGPYFAMISELAPRGVSGATIATVNSVGALGSFTGTYLVGWLRGSSLGNAGAFGFMAAATLVSALLVFAVRDPGRGAAAAGDGSGTGTVIGAPAGPDAGRS